MQVTVRTSGQTAILDLAGRLVFGDGDDRLKEEVQALLSSGTRAILINMEAITFMDTGGILSLLTCYKRAAEASGALKLLKPTRKTMEILTISGLNKVLDIFQDEAQALASF